MIDNSLERPIAAWAVEELQALVAELGSNVVPGEEAPERLAQVEVLEALKSAVCAAQVRITAAYAAAETARLESLGRGPAPAAVVGSEVGLARHESPARGRSLARAAAALVDDLPETLAALARGELNEERALLMVRETEHLCAEDRRALDTEVAGQSGGPGGMGTEQLRRLVQRIALRLDEAGATARMRRARAQRHVSGRLLADGTGRITAVVRSEDYRAVLAALTSVAAAARAEGDSRTSDQVRADALVHRVTGIDPAAPAKVELHLVMGISSLLAEADGPDGAEPGWVPGAGHLPAGVCRDLFARAAEADRATVRRLFTIPEDGQLIAMESCSRVFLGLLARMIRLRDGETCRTPWCDAPIRHIDHVVPDARGGPTSFDNGQGLCETCNQVKEAPGWISWTGPAGLGATVTTRTASGRIHRSGHSPLAS